MMSKKVTANWNKSITGKAMHSACIYSFSPSARIPSLTAIYRILEVCGAKKIRQALCSQGIYNHFQSVQSLSRVRLFATPWIAARQASLSITNSQSSLRLMSIESVMPSNHLILCRPLLLLPPIPPSIRVFQMSQLFAWGGQSTGVSALASFLPKKPQGWSLSEWTGWIFGD